MDQMTKLKKFEESIYQEIDIKIAQIKKETEENNIETLNKEQDKAIQKFSAILQTRTADIRKEQKRDVASYSLTCKRDLLEKRNEITRIIFGNVAARLKEFSASDKYQAYLEKSLKGFSEKYKLSGATIAVCEKDIALSDKIKKAYSLPCTVVASKDIRLGGFTVTSATDGFFYDETLDSKLEEQKKYFIQNSEFKL